MDHELISVKLFLKRAYVTRTYDLGITEARRDKGIEKERTEVVRF